MSSNQPLLSLQDVRRYYHSGDNTVRALDGVSLDISAGEFMAVMGQSGSGKSTLMNILGCLDRSTGGRYLVQGTDVARLTLDELAALRRDTFGFIFQRYNLLATATAEENVEIPSIYAGTPREERLTRARGLLERLGLGPRARHKPSELSGGQQQRVAIARALVNNPAVILADEPTGALDSKSGAEMMALLADLHREGRTIILITHDEKVASHAERIIRIADGKITSDEPHPSLREGPGAENPETTRVVSSPPPLSPPGGRGSLGPEVGPEIHEAVKMALRALHVNFFRTALTLLGIVIGVAAVVIMLAVGDGSKQKVLDRISAMGTNILSVRPGAPGMRGGGDIITLTAEDASAILAIPNVDIAVPERNGRFTARYGNIDYATLVQGTGADLPQARDWPTAEGHFFSARDLTGFAPVAILGKTVAKNLFPGGASPLGEYVLIKNTPFEVIGVMSEKGASGFGTDQDDVIFIPYTTSLIRLFGRPYLSFITVKVKDVNEIDATQEAIQSLLLARHRTEDFSIRNSAAFLETATETQNTLTFLLGAVAAISLLVGGIGVMNIMLVSVTERTREIGIRMATGARMRDIMLQFNTEAAVVCTLGGVLGVMIGFAGGLILGGFGVSVSFSLFPALLAFTCAVLTGFIFGYLPAKKAAQLDPVVALASE